MQNLKCNGLIASCYTSSAITTVINQNNSSRVLNPNFTTTTKIAINIELAASILCKPGPLISHCLDIFPCNDQ